MNQSNTTMAAEHHVHRDDVGAKMGMWLFLFTELLLFGGLFLVYAVYRFKHGDQFRLAATDLDTFLGTINTIILLTSSLTMAFSITALRRGNKVFAITNVSLTVVFAVVFLVNKYFEWAHKIHLGIYPGSDDLLARQNGEILFFGLYYVMTGLHALHVIIGITILVFMLVFLIRGSVTSENYIKLENSGLYWHLVDLIWIFLFPLFYLIH